MLCGKPVLLVTSPQGKERRAEEEVGNTLFPYDPGITIQHTRFPGVLLVCSESLSPDEAYRLLGTRYQAYVKKVLPCHIVVKVSGEVEQVLAKRSAELVSGRVAKSEAVRINCVSRGLKLRCSELKNMVASKLRNMGYRVLWRNHDWQLNIETLGEIAVIGIRRAKSTNH